VAFYLIKKRTFPLQKASENTSTLFLLQGLVSERAEAVRIYKELWQNMYLILGLWDCCPQLF
jgi:type III secretory pathway lipoprotein EscJ